MATIRDIATKAGYSIATVSRVLNCDKTLSVSDQAREKIIRAAEELNYRTLKERAAKKPKTSYRIGMIQMNTERDEIHDPYFLAIRLGIEQECMANQHEVIKVFQKSQRLDLSDFDTFDGIIAVGLTLDEDIKEMEKYTDYITFVDSSPKEASHDSVVIDFQKSMNEVLDFFTAAEHRRIGFIGGMRHNISKDTFIMDEREKTFREYLKEKNLFHEDYIFSGQFTTEEGYRLMKEALKLKNLPTAFFVASDSMAIGALRVLHENNHSVPGDVSLIGFNDIAASKYLQPSLSTVKVHTKFMGESAVELMLERIQSKRKIPKKIVIPTELIIRESTSSVTSNI